MSSRTQTFGVYRGDVLDSRADVVLAPVKFPHVAIPIDRLDMVARIYPRAYDESIGFFRRRERSGNPCFVVSVPTSMPSMIPPHFLVLWRDGHRMRLDEVAATLRSIAGKFMVSVLAEWRKGCRVAVSSEICGAAAWPAVRPLVIEALASLPGVRLDLYEPTTPRKPTEECQACCSR